MPLAQMMGKVPTVVPEVETIPPVELKPWEQQNQETSRQFQAFAHYRDQGPRRTMEETARWLEIVRLTDAHERLRQRYAARGMPIPARLNVDEIDWMMGEKQRKRRRRNTKSRGMIWVWAKQNRWKDRVLAYDRWLDQAAQDAAVKEVEEMVKRHLALSGMLQSKAAARLRELEHGELSPKALLAFITEGVKLERLTRDLSTDKQTVAGDAENPLIVEHASSAKELLRNKLQLIAERKAKSDNALEEMRALPAPRGEEETEDQ